MTDIRQQIVIARARASYLSEQPDQVDANMHSANADSLEKLLAALEQLSRHFGSAEQCRELALAALDQTMQEPPLHDAEQESEWWMW